MNNSAYLATAVAMLVIIALLLIMLFSRRHSQAGPALTELISRLHQLEGDLATTRETRTVHERDLAVERERSSRIAGLEQALLHEGARADTERETRSVVERQLATATEAQSRIEIALTGTGVQVKVLETAHHAAMEQVKAFQIERSRLDSSLAEKVAVLKERDEDIFDFLKQGTEKAADLEAMRIERGELERRLSTLQETLDQERKQAGEKLLLLVEARDSMTREFRTLANEVMTQHGETFGKQNREQIDTVLRPLREKLAEFQNGLQVAQNDSTKERAILGEQIRHLSESSAKMTTETVNLTRAERKGPDTGRLG